MHRLFIRTFEIGHVRVIFSRSVLISSTMMLPPFTKLLLYLYNCTLCLDLTGVAEWEWVSLQNDTEEEDISIMVEWQCESRAVLRQKLLEELEIEVSRLL